MTGEVETIERNGVEFSATGLKMPEKMTFAEWDALGEQLATMHQASAWWIGDWYNAGEAAYGESAAQAKAISEHAAAHGRQLSPQTVIDYAGVCRRFEIAKRFANLSFGHHTAVRALPAPEADEIMRKAEAEGWSIRELKQRVSGKEPASEEPPQVSTAGPDEYTVIMADPPWRYSNSGVNGAASKHYATMTEDEIFEYLGKTGVKVAENAVLFLWCTNPLFDQALNVMAAWGFEYKSLVTWRKMRNGKVAFGSGFYFRSATEHMMLGVRGSMPPESKNERSVFDGEILEHSRKPYEAYELIERMYPGARRLELFARHERHGWDRMGLEAPPAKQPAGE